MTKRHVIGFIGFIGSGKDTAADYLVNEKGFLRESFASSLKDVVAAVFGWNREFLEGKTKESRAWRDQKDEWWSNRLGMHITPRWVLQHWGTGVLRQGFHDDIWIASLENKLQKTSENIVISDVRFPNEIKSIHNAGGIVVRVRRGEDPVWFDLAASANAGNESAKIMFAEYKIHSSESAWIGCNIDKVIFNNGSFDDLYRQVESLIIDPALNLLASNLLEDYEESGDNLRTQF